MIEIIAFTDGHNTYNRYDGDEGKGRFSINLSKWYEMEELMNKPDVLIKIVKSKGILYSLGETIMIKGSRFMINSFRRTSSSIEMGLVFLQ